MLVAVRCAGLGHSFIRPVVAVSADGVLLVGGHGEDLLGPGRPRVVVREALPDPAHAADLGLAIAVGVPVSLEPPPGLS
jgi:hypothetical protein